MEYTNLGRTGCKVSRICLGTMNFGPRTNEGDSHAIMNKAVELGVQFWDTADVYGGKQREGITEQIIGNWLAANPEKREQIVLATKFQGTMGKGPNDRGASAFHIRKACEDSLRRLRTDHIDLYQMHHINRDCAWEEVYGAQQVGEALKKAAFFDGKNPASVLVTGSGTSREIGFVTGDGAWDKEEMIQAFELLGEELAETLGKPLTIRLLDDAMTEHKRMQIE